MDKKWYQSKTYWGAALVGIGFLYEYVVGDMATGELIKGLGLAMMGIGIRSAL